MKQIATIAILVMLFTSCANNETKFDATGTFEATEITVSAEAVGRVLSLDITEGAQVEAHTPVGVIDSVQLYLQKLQLLKSITSVESNRPSINKQVAAIRAQIANQKVEQQRIQNLLKSNAATPKQLDDINASITVLQQQLGAQQASLTNSISSINAQSSAMEIQVAQLTDRLNKCIIQSPITGIVLAQYIEAGELATTGKPLFKVANLNSVYLKAYITSSQLADIKLGQQVDVTATFGGDKNRAYKGTITWIADKSEFTPKSIQTKDDRANQVYALKIAVQNDGYIKLGMYGEVIF